MKLVINIFAVIAVVTADVNNLLISNDYLPPLENGVSLEGPTNEYLAPVAEHGADLAADGYHYKTHRRVFFRRQRRDVGQLNKEYLPPLQEGIPANEYLPPVPESLGAPVEAPVNNYLAPALPLAQTNYQSTLPVAAPVTEGSQLLSHDFIQEDNKIHSPHVDVPDEVSVQNALVEAAPAHELAADGYHYKTQRRVVYRRHRRDVSHLSSNEYLPPVQEGELPSYEYLPPLPQPLVGAPVNNYVAPDPVPQIPSDALVSEVTHVVSEAPVLDVSQLNKAFAPESVRGQDAVLENKIYSPVSGPEVKQLASAAPVSDIPVHVVADVPAKSDTVDAVPAHELAADGYHYKTHRRVVYRRH